MPALPIDEARLSHWTRREETEINRRSDMSKQLPLVASQR